MFIWTQFIDQLPVGLLAQLVERCTGIAEVMGSNPVRAWIFQVLFSTIRFSSVLGCEDFTSTYSLRNCEGKLAVPLSRTDFLEKITLSLPTNLRQAQTIASCKSGCRGFLFDNKLIN